MENLIFTSIHSYFFALQLAQSNRQLFRFNFLIIPTALFSLDFFFASTIPSWMCSTQRSSIESISITSGHFIVIEMNFYVSSSNNPCLVPFFIAFGPCFCPIDGRRENVSTSSKVQVRRARRKALSNPQEVPQWRRLQCSFRLSVSLRAPSSKFHHKHSRWVTIACACPSRVQKRAKHNHMCDG
jgi:hypothetical protein